MALNLRAVPTDAAGASERRADRALPSPIPAPLDQTYTCVQHTASLTTCYAHQSAFATSQGAAVSQGQVIGYVGNTGRSFGAHLHFETRVDGSPVDPLGYL